VRFITHVGLVAVVVALDASTAERVVIEVLRAVKEAVSRLSLKERGLWVSKNPYNDDTFRVDVAAERAALNAIRDLGFRGTVISEESGVTRMGEERQIIILDPLDGSRNALKGVPFYSASIAIAEGNKFKDIVAAGVMDLARGIIIRSKGEYVLINDRVASPSSVKSVEEAYVSILLKLKEIVDADEYGRKALVLLKRVGYPRLFGSAALETAYVAVGLLDAFVDLVPRLRVFDVVPSFYLLLKSGGYLKMLNIASIDSLDLTKSKRLAFIAAGNRILGEEIYRIMMTF